MSIWITALGVSGIGAVYGFVLFYAIKRCLPPIADQSPSFKEIVSSFVAIGIGLLGASLLTVDGINYIGPYGIGMFVGAAINTGITLEHLLRERQKEKFQTSAPSRRSVRPAHNI